MSDFLTLHSTASSGSEKSALRKWYEKVAGGTALARTKKHIEYGAHSLRAGGESLLVGAALGAADNMLKGGLDVEVARDKSGKLYHVPVDGAVAALGLIAGTAMAHEEFGKDLVNAGAAAAAVFGYRKSRDYVAAQMRVKGKTPGYQNTAAFVKSIAVGTAPLAAHGEGDEDPILEASRLL